AYCRSRGTREIVGEALPQNTRVIRLVRGLGFEVTAAPEEGTMRLRLPLDGTNSPLLLEGTTLN
ncbi:MAG TPA: hypothetical protein VFS02_06075, partial [Telluria sp.]|nr:hypothetical protein [Telluria sp.]